MREIFQATGRRKTAIARVCLIAGDGTVEVNDRSLENYFPSDSLRGRIQRPFVLTQKQKEFNVLCRVNGGGIAAQADAITHGISRALLKVDSKLRSLIKKEKLLTRDPRMKERKKYGQKGARKRFQFSKR